MVEIVVQIMSIQQKRNYIFTIIGLAVIILLLVISHDKETVEVPVLAKQSEVVEDTTLVLSQASDLTSQSRSIEAVGEVTANSIHQIRSQISSNITYLPIEIGDIVGAGYVIARAENTDEQIEYKRAQERLLVQERTLDIMKRGASDNEEALLATRIDGSQQQINETHTSALQLVRTIQDTTQNILSSNVSPLFTDPFGPYPELRFTTFDSGMVYRIEDDHRSLRTKVDAVQDIDISLYTTPKEIRDDLLPTLYIAREFLRDIGLAIDTALPATPEIEARLPLWRQNISNGANSINALISQLIAINEKYTSQMTAYTITSDEQTLSLTGAANEEIARQEALVRDAELGVSEALVKLNKTIFTSNIYGTVSEVAVDNGDLISPGALIARIINTNSLQIKISLPIKDAQEISRGSTVIIQSNGTGYVSKIAPNISPETGKVEIIIEVNDKGSEGLVIGDFVTISILTEGTNQLRIPVSAIVSEDKVPAVYIQTQEGTYTRTSIVLGEVYGESIEVLLGITPEMIIVINPQYLTEDTLSL